MEIECYEGNIHGVCHHLGRIFYVFAIYILTASAICWFEFTMLFLEVAEDAPGSSSWEQSWL